MTDAETVERVTDLKDEIDMAYTRLMTICNEVQAGKRQGGGREFERYIDAQFRSIREALRALTKEGDAG